MNTNEMLIKARTQVILQQPFLAGLLMLLALKGDPTCPVMATDGETLHYNPALMDHFTLAEVKGILVHEVLHCALRHPFRITGKEHRLWNMACDYVVNLQVQDMGFELPKGFLLDATYRNMDAETVYGHLQNRSGGANDPQADPSATQPKQDPNNSEGSQGSTQSKQDPNNSEDSKDSTQQKQDPNKSEGSQGSTQPKQAPTKSEGPKGSIPPELMGQVVQPSEKKTDTLAQEWKMAVAIARQIAKKQGHLPGGLDRAIQATKKSTMAWREALRSFLHRAEPNDFSFTRPDRRFIHQGLYLPGRDTQPTMGTLVLAVDTSGSITQDMLDSFASELTALVQEVQPETLVILICDFQIQAILTPNPEDPIDLPLIGGGGTSFVEVFDWANTRQPDVLIYLTDLYGYFPEQAPTYPVLWVVHDPTYPEPPFGEVIHLPIH